MFLLIHFNVLVWLQCGILQPDHMFWVYKPLQTLYASLVELIEIHLKMSFTEVQKFLGYTTKSRNIQRKQSDKAA